MSVCARPSDRSFVCAPNYVWHKIFIVYFTFLKSISFLFYLGILNFISVKLEFRLNVIHFRAITAHDFHKMLYCN